MVAETRERGFRGEVSAFVSLGVPIALSYAGNQLLGVVDTAMVGRLDAVSLAAVGIGNGIYSTVSLVAMGILLGMDPLVSQAVGAGEQERARRVLWQAARLSLYASLPCVVLIVLISALGRQIGLDGDTADHVLSFGVGRVLNVVPFLLGVAARTYLQAVGRPGAAAWAMVWANVTNFVGNVLFIYGDGGLSYFGLPGIGLPALGVFGSGLSSTIASVASVLVVYREVRRFSGPIRVGELRADWPMMRSIVRMGFPIGMHLLAEVGAFSLAGIFAGWLGPACAAGNQVAISLASFSFTIALGVANATSVLVGRAVGRGDTPSARRAGFLGLGLSMGAMGVSAILFAVAPWFCARLLTDKPEVIAQAVPLLRIAAVFQLADAAQVVAAGALRGAGDTRSAQVANMAGYYLLGLPLALLLGFVFKMGAPGLWWGLTAALFAVAISLSIRFYSLSKREIVRVG